MHKQGGFETLMGRLRAKPILTLERLLGFDDRGTRIIVAAALLIGVAMRIAHNIFRAKIGAGGEAANVAVAIAQGRGFADPFRVGQGATAHLLPISPGIGGLVYSLFGVHSLPAEIILATWSIMLAFGSYVVFSHVFRRLGVTDQARAGAMLVLSLVPVFVKVEAVDFRIWEGALAVMLSALFLLQATAVLIALTAALLFFVNPIIGIGGFLCLGLLSRARWTLGKSASVVALTVLFSASWVAPWALRNKQVLGEPVLLRSNAGLELAIATDPAMLGSRAREQLYRKRLSLLHPNQSPAAFDRMKRFGEVRYARMLGQQTLHWIPSSSRYRSKARTPPPARNVRPRTLELSGLGKIKMGCRRIGVGHHGRLGGARGDVRRIYPRAGKVAPDCDHDSSPGGRHEPLPADQSLHIYFLRHADILRDGFSVSLVSRISVLVRDIASWRRDVSFSRL